MRDYRIDYRRLNGTRITLETASKYRVQAIQFAWRDLTPWALGSTPYRIVGIDTPASHGLGLGYLVVTVETV